MGIAACGVPNPRCCDCPKDDKGDDKSDQDQGAGGGMAVDREADDDDEEEEEEGANADEDDEDGSPLENDEAASAFFSSTACQASRDASVSTSSSTICPLLMPLLLPSRESGWLLSRDAWKISSPRATAICSKSMDCVAVRSNSAKT
jgi:hypothetical protein